MKYRVESGKLTVTAKSAVHDTTTVWSKVGGDVDADPDHLDTASASFSVDMTACDAGDWLKNRKLRSDFQLADHPTATFRLDRVSEIVRDGQAFTATARGTLSWRGKQVGLELAGKGTLDAMRLEASATFHLDIRTLGLSAPRFLMIKMSDEVTVAVEIRGRAA